MAALAVLALFAGLNVLHGYDSLSGVCLALACAAMLLHTVIDFHLYQSPILMLLGAYAGRLSCRYAQQTGSVVIIMQLSKTIWPMFLAQRPINSTNKAVLLVVELAFTLVVNPIEGLCIIALGGKTFSARSQLAFYYKGT